MITVDLNTLELNEFTARDDGRQHCKATFPLIGLHGSRELASVYFEIEPGDNLGMHTDSAEELLVILDGEFEARIGDKTTTLHKGNLALVPQLVPHDLKNIGLEKARVLGVFGGANNIIANFEKEWLSTHSNVVDTSLLG